MPSVKTKKACKPRYYVEATGAGESTVGIMLGMQAAPITCSDGVTRQLRGCERAFVDRLIFDKELVGEELVTIFVDDGRGPRKLIGQTIKPVSFLGRDFNPSRSPLHM